MQDFGAIHVAVLKRLKTDTSIALKESQMKQFHQTNPDTDNADLNQASFKEAIHILTKKNAWLFVLIIYLNRGVEMTLNSDQNKKLK